MGKNRKARPEPKPVVNDDEDFFDEEIPDQEPIDEIEALKAKIASLEAQLGDEEKKTGLLKRLGAFVKKHKAPIAAGVGLVVGGTIAAVSASINNTPVEVNFLDALPDNGEQEEDEDNEDDVDVTVVDI